MTSFDASSAPLTTELAPVLLLLPSSLPDSSEDVLIEGLLSEDKLFVPNSTETGPLEATRACGCEMVELVRDFENVVKTWFKRARV